MAPAPFPIIRRLRSGWAAFWVTSGQRQADCRVLLGDPKLPVRELLSAFAGIGPVTICTNLIRCQRNPLRAKTLMTHIEDDRGEDDDEMSMIDVNDIRPRTSQLDRPKLECIANDRLAMSKASPLYPNRDRIGEQLKRREGPEGDKRRCSNMARSRTLVLINGRRRFSARN
jgi:hypothetical protein